jgi:hypothetical protein
MNRSPNVIITMTEAEDTPVSVSNSLQLVLERVRCAATMSVEVILATS